MTMTAQLSAPPADVSAARGALRQRLVGVTAPIGWAVLGFALVVALWQFAAWRSDGVPTPLDTWNELRTLLSDPFRDAGPNDKGVGVLLKNSLLRVLAGFAIAVVIGIPLGLSMGSSRRVWQTFNPVIQVLRPVSPLAWFPLWLYALKAAGQAGMWVIFITAVWPIVLNSATAAASVPVDQHNVARVFRLPRHAYVRHILLPHSLPGIVTGMRLSMGTGWMVIVAVEMLSNQSGIGGYVWETYNALNLARVAALVIMIGVVGLVLDVAFLRLGKLVTHQEARA